MITLILCVKHDSEKGEIYMGNDVLTYDYPVKINGKFFPAGTPIRDVPYSPFPEKPVVELCAACREATGMEYIEK